MGRIEKDQIISIPRWRFLVWRVFYWLCAALSLLLGGFSVGVMLYLFVDFHKHGLWAMPHDVIDFLAMVPFLWIIALVLFIVIARIGLKHTKKGYRYPIRVMVLGCVILSIIFGSILNFFGVGKITHEFLNTIPLYDSLVLDSGEAYSRPVVGRLAGVITSIQDNNNFSVTDFNGRTWKVRVATSTGSFVPVASSTIRMFGLLESSTSVFIARSVHNWEQ